MSHRNEAIRSRSSPYHCSIPQDVIDIQILHRLPTKSLFRFKSVSRYWNSLISSYAFAKNHVKHRQVYCIPNLFFQNSKLFSLKILDTQEIDHDTGFNFSISRSMHDYEPPDNGFPMKRELIGSCNGLICIQFQTKNYKDARRGHITCFLMWNPLISLPRRTIEGPFIPYQSDIIAAGFGFGSSSDDYKIVVLAKDLNKRSTVVHIFSSRRDRWTKLKTEECLPIDYGINRTEVSQAVLANETLYWLLEDKKHGPKLVAFELNNDSFSLVPLPNNIPMVLHKKDSLLICKTRHCLCVYWKKKGSDLINESIGLEVWILQDSWTQLFQFTRLDSGERRTITYLNSQSLHRDQEDKVLYLETENHNLNSIHTSEQGYGRCIALSTVIPVDDYYELRCGFSYIESLVSPFFHVGRAKTTRKAKSQYKFGEYK